MTLKYFEITIYEDALSLLLNNKTNIKAEILTQLQQEDPIIESIGEELHDLCDRLTLNTDKIITKFENQSCEELMKYISFSEAGITFDYEESINCENRRICAFKRKLLVTAKSASKRELSIYTPLTVIPYSWNTGYYHSFKIMSILLIKSILIFALTYIY